LTPGARRGDDRGGRGESTAWKESSHGRAVMAKVLLPQGILWEQDDWSSGRSESAETVTKFRIPEGITWTERKADLR